MNNLAEILNPLNNKAVEELEEELLEKFPQLDLTIDPAERLLESPKIERLVEEIASEEDPKPIP